MSSFTRLLWITAAACALSTRSGQAQSRVTIFPRWPGEARVGWSDALEGRNAIGALSTDLLRDSLARRGQRVRGAPPAELQGVVSLAVDLGLVSFGQVSVGLSGALISRFRLEQSDNDALSSDYMVGFPIVYTAEQLTVRVRPMHRSGHLGDELVIKSAVRRLEYDHEEIEVVAAWTHGMLRPYIGGSITVASSYSDDTGGVKAGIDLRGELGPLGVVGGFDWQRTGISGWGDRYSSAGGVQWMRGGRGVTLLLRNVSGTTSVGEFFADRERYWGLEIILKP